ncbi:hypothetical protein DLM45_02675 [Hyphomicrobium methylovorum]|uniref:hypothetical protein n=1 Tax=Hyphomicrobium methylovorum TaxID=84 RepID=UPI0015E665B5|nr:hypothetical protein [Hyphomicrobium methylovorum]MBA2125129.1 hypothetical protein [Hyphomicrobium methylovorum]
MKKSLIAAAAFAVISLGAAGSASAGVPSGLNGISAHANTTVAEQVQYRRDHRHYKKRHYKKNWWHKKKWVCRYRHGHRHCFWR